MAFFETVKITGEAGATLDGTAGTPSTGVVTIQGVGSGTAVPVSNTGTFAVQAAITAALASLVDGAIVTLGLKADAKNSATDTTSITVMQVLKEMSYMLQNPASQAVTNVGTFAVQAAITAAAAAIADGAIVTLGSKADAKSTATDTTAITIMQVLKEISAMVQAPPSTPVTNVGTFAVQAVATGDAASGSPVAGNPVLMGGSDGTDARTVATDSGGQVKVLVEGGTGIPVTNAGTFAVQAAITAAAASIADAAIVTLGSKADAKSTATDTTAVTIMQVLKEISAQVQAPPSQAVTNAGTFAVQDSTSEGYLATLAGVVTSSKATVTGTVTSNQGTPAAVSSPWPVEISDGTNTNTVKAASTASVAGDKSLVVQISPNQPNLTTPLNVQDSSDVAQASTTSGQVGPLVQMATVTSAPTDANAKTNPLRGDAAGCLRINPAGQTSSFKSYTQSKAGNVVNTLTVGAGKKWVLHSISLILTTNSTAGNRTPGCYVEDASSDVMCNINAGVAMTAAPGTNYFTFAPSLPLSTTVVSSCVSVPYPMFVLGPGATVNGVVGSGLAGDTYILTICVEEYND